MIFKKKRDLSVNELKLELQRKKDEGILEEQKQKDLQKKIQLSKQIEDIDMLSRNERWYKINCWPQKFRRRFRKDRVIVANIELNNGDATQVLVVVGPDLMFTYRKCDYIIDDSLKQWNSAYQMFQLDYHQGFSMPIKRKIPLNKIREGFIQAKIENVHYATNPSVLRTFLNSSVIQSSIQSTNITDFFKQIRLLIIVTMFASIMHLLFYLYQSGAFEGLKNVGGG